MAAASPFPIAVASPLFAAPNERTDTLPNLGELATAVLANLHWIAACTALVSLIALGFYELQLPVYTSVARVLVQTEQLGAPSFLSGITPYRDSQIPEAANRRLETEIALIASQSNAVQVVRSLEVRRRQLPASALAQSSLWLSEHAPSWWKKWRGRNQKPLPPQAQVDAATATALLANLTIEPVRSKTAETTSNVLEIKLKTADFDLTPRALDALLKAYLLSSGGKSQQIGAATTALLDEQVAGAAAQLERLEGDILGLATRRSSRSDGSVPAIPIGPAGDSASGRDASRAANDAAVTQLTNQVVDLQARYEEQRMSFTDDAPAVRNLRDRLNATRARLATTIRSSAADNLDFSRLERQRGLLQDRYLELRRKRDQITLFTQLNPSSMEGREVVDAPSIPDLLTSTKSKLPLVVGPLAGLLLGLLIAGLREALDQRLRTPRDVERALGLRTLGRLPRLDRKRVLAVRVATLSRAELRALSRP